METCLEGAKEWCLINSEVMEVIMNSSVVWMKSFSCIKKMYFTDVYPEACCMRISHHVRYPGSKFHTFV